jgi:hypothetical protein
MVAISYTLILTIYHDIILFPTLPERARTTATPTRIIIVSLDLKAKIVVVSIVNK